jgi:hypothetical protein
MSTSADPQFARRGLRKALVAFLWGALLLLQAGSLLPAAPSTAASTSSLIYCGWFGNTIPTPAFIAANKAFLETQPFHGLVAYLRNDSTGVNVTTNVMTTTPMSYATISSVLTPLRNTVFTTLKENFGLIQGSRPPDFFDDWSVTIQNFANAALALKDAGLKGIVFDNEQYFSPWGNYPTGVKYATRTLAEYQTQARLRGKQLMEAMVAQFPTIAVITLHGPTVSEPKVPTPLFPVWYSANELLGPLFVGMMEGTPSGALNIDGGELYHLRSSDQFLQSYNWRKYTHPSDALNSSIIPPADRPSWPGKCSLGFGIYDRPFSGASMDATILRTTIANALRQADRYTWFYTEGPSYLLPSSSGGASSAWVSAVRNGISDAGATGGGTSGAPPTAPSQFLATTVSSTIVDLAWSDMSSNESGFEVERKTSTTGTWSRVLTTGANVSTIDDTGAAASTTYTYRCRAVNSSGASAYSNESSATTSAPPVPVPTAPSNLAASATSATGASLSWWDMSNNETGFEVERKTGSAGTWSRVLTTGANVSTINDGGLTAGTSYFYRCRAVNGSGPSGYSNEASITTPAASGPVPAAPIHLKIYSLATARISIDWWDMSNNETGFEVERKTGSAGTWARIATKPANTSIHADTTVTSGRLYYYRVRSINGNGPSAWSNEISQTAP